MSPGIVASLTFAVIGPWGPVVSYQYSDILMINMIIVCLYSLAQGYTSCDKRLSAKSTLGIQQVESSEGLNDVQYVLLPSSSLRGNCKCLIMSSSKCTSDQNG